MTSPPVIVAATANPAKLSEIREILDGILEVLPRPPGLPDVSEDAPDLVGNARLKANAVAIATGRSALADDTGLEVAALGGAPGVRSARYAGDDATDAENVTLLLHRMRGVTDRSACFHTVVIVAGGSGEVISHGLCEGTIATEPRGGGGFGYDPVFVPAEGDGRTFAEMSAGEKHGMSHRGRALRGLLELVAGDGVERFDGR
ncbi:MAG: RdgB/HAM1 family non-canonical purine NTP pyrophosphatase [Microthrixaceae bacterium]|nr:RdgB/HAM1 family non-canonical purine NTP pyrophosphatase [Microthrixaceae bacterium]